MPHTVLEPGGHCPTASAWLLRTDLGEEPRVCVHRHRRYGLLMQPGGHVERDENAWAAVLREVREEAGFEADQLRVLQPFPPVSLGGNDVATPTPLLQDCHRVEPTPTYHWDSVFALVADGPPRRPVAEGESDDVRWLTVAELAADPAALPAAVVIARRAVEAYGVWQAIPAVEYPTHVVRHPRDESPTSQEERMSEPTTAVTDNPEQSRYEITVDGQQAGFADYRVEGDVVVIPHTEVSPEFGGQGLGGKLVQGTLDAIRAAGGKVQPDCPFVASWIDKHRDYADLLA